MKLELRTNNNNNNSNPFDVTSGSARIAKLSDLAVIWIVIMSIVLS
jgi:hypothetical protein